MKKALIILIILAVIVCGIFSLFYFVWTPQNMKSWGDDAIADGRLDKAVSWYERAVKADPMNVDYVLALVDANVLSQNYTQAERNLMQAIERNPNASLYAKLSSVYVLQDKLSDAQKMLDGISDPSIRSTLDSLRPSAPEVTPEGGMEYNELISVTIASEYQVYYSLDDTFPSTFTAPYESPIALEPGTTRLQAIAVSQDGLVSPLIDTSYLLVGVVQEIQFVSSEFETMIRGMLYLSSIDPIMTDALWQITELEIPEYITDYTDLQYFEELKSLRINNSAVEDYSFLSHLGNLEILDVSGSLISEDTLKYISLLPNLKELNLSNCGCTDISALSAATNLVSLDLSSNSVQDITCLEGLENLQILNLESNAITLLDSLGRMAALTELNIAKNNLSSLDPLVSSVGLVKLVADDNKLMDISVLQEMTNLSHFTAANNHIADASYLSACTKMSYLVLANNRLSSIDAIADMPELMYLDISNNSIAALPELGKMEQLQYFYASHNLLADISCLAEQPLLAYVNVDYNPELVEIDFLTTCPMIVKVDIFGTMAYDIQGLLDMSVIVNYDPAAVIENQQKAEEAEKEAEDSEDTDE